MNYPSRFLLALYLFVLLFATPTLYAFQYLDFSSTAGLTLVGNAAQFGNVLRLTPAIPSQVGGAWYDTKTSVTGGFVTQFQFQITSSSGADGFAFVIQNDSLSALGTAGGGLGYDGMPDSLAVEFDTYQNAGDPNDNQLGVHTGGTGPNSYLESYSLGSTTAIPYMKDGLVHTVKIVYSPGTLTIFMDDFSTPALTVAVDIGSTLALDSGNAYVGFTAGTGGLWENHDILNWTFSGSGQSAAMEAGGAFALYASTQTCSGSALMYQRLVGGKPTGSPRTLTDCDAGVQDVDVFKDKPSATYWILYGTSEGKFMMRITKAGGILQKPVKVLDSTQAGGALGAAAISGPGATFYLMTAVNGVIQRVAVNRNTLRFISITPTTLAASGSAVQASQNVSNRVVAFDSGAELAGSMLALNGLPVGGLLDLFPPASGSHTTGGIAADGRMSYSINNADELWVSKVGADGVARGPVYKVAVGGGMTAADVSNPVGDFRFVLYRNANGLYVQKITTAGNSIGSAAFIGF